MFIEIITPDSKLYSGEVIAVQFPGSNGSFGVLNNHTALISTLKQGNIKLTDNKGDIKQITISGGVVEVLNNNILVLAE